MEDTIRDRFLRSLLAAGTVFEVPDDLKTIETLFTDPLSLTVTEKGLMLHANGFFHVPFHQELADATVELMNARMFRKYGEDVVSGYDFECDLYSEKVHQRIFRAYADKFGPREVFLYAIHFRNRHDRLSIVFDMVTRILEEMYVLVI